ncbi:hypothetical protein [Methylocaldum sp.]|uniref:hypothetical protein n=1 Tax=Methylocaldum sp. TaxID=1969727 RepID=UPI002D3FF56A|nr:hypothetical protein [Methylocaldum sp.]HYE38226.1 hypothetical protein [Methylocaldum sp.]
MRTPLQLPPGLIGDDTTSTAAGRYYDSDNVRFWREQPQTDGGWERISTTALSGVCRGVLIWTDNDGVVNIGFGTHASLEVWYGGELAVITPAGLSDGEIDATGGVGYGTGTYSTGEYGEPSVVDYYPRSWALATWGENLLASPRGGKLYVWENDTAEVATEITQAPDHFDYMIVTPQRQVMGFGVNEEVSGDYNPLCIRWCDLEDYTDWTTSATNNAGEEILSGGGRIISAKVIGHQIFIWTDNGLHVAQFLGDPGQTFQFDQVGYNCGLIGPNAAVVIGHTAYWMAPDGQFYTCSVGGAPTPMICPIGAEVRDNLTAAQKDKVYASSLSTYQEVRWDYPDERDGVECSRYVRVNTIDGAWSRGQMVRTAMTDAGPAPHPVGVDYDGNIYWHERGNSADGGVFSASVETADQSISEDELVFLRGLWPDFKDQQGSVSVTVITRMYPQGPETEHGPYICTPGKEKVDFRATGKIARVRFSSNSSPTFWRLGKPAFDVQPAGRR